MKNKNNDYLAVSSQLMLTPETSLANRPAPVIQRKLSPVLKRAAAGCFEGEIRYTFIARVIDIIDLKKIAFVRNQQRGRREPEVLLKQLFIEMQDDYIRKWGELVDRYEAEHGKINIKI